MNISGGLVKLAMLCLYSRIPQTIVKNNVLTWKKSPRNASRNTGSLSMQGRSFPFKEIGQGFKIMFKGIWEILFREQK